jgi:hypothetical protein
MGLPKFISDWLNKKCREDPRYKGIRSRRVPDGTDALAIDMNGMIHAGIQMAWGIGDYKNDKIFEKMSKATQYKKFDNIVSAITKILLNTVRLVSPKKALLLFVDGKAPSAKIKQQRERRFRSAVDADGSFPDTSIVTPGTEFMEALDVAIRAFIADKRAQLPPVVNYSGHRTPGEGEHKIMSFLRSRKTPYKNGLVVYGMDADLLMLCAISPQDKIYLMRESADNVLNIDNFKRALIDSAPEEQKETALKDFVALMFTIGNDFLPSGPLHQSMYKQVEGLMDSYYFIKRPLTLPEEGSSENTTNVNVIDFEALGMILTKFGNTEYRLASRENIKKDPRNNPNRFINVAVRTKPFSGGRNRYYFDVQLFRSLWYNNEFMPAGQLSDWGLLPNPNVSDIEDMCKSYAEGIAWSFRYYQIRSINTEWYYPYNHPPLKADMATYLSQITPEEALKFNELPKKRTSYRYGLLEQLLAVIHPNSAKNSLPVEIRHLALDPKSPIFDLFHMGHIIEKDGIADQFAYTFRNIVAPFNMKRIADVLAKMDIPLLESRWGDQKRSISIATDEQSKTWVKRREVFVKDERLKIKADQKKNIEEKKKREEIALEKSSGVEMIKPDQKKKIVYPTVITGGGGQRNIRGEDSTKTDAQFLRRALPTEYDAPLGTIKKIEAVPKKEEVSTKGGKYSLGGRGRGTPFVRGNNRGGRGGQYSRGGRGGQYSRGGRSVDQGGRGGRSVDQGGQYFRGGRGRGKSVDSALKKKIPPPTE